MVSSWEQLEHKKLTFAGFAPGIGEIPVEQQHVNASLRGPNGGLGMQWMWRANKNGFDAGFPHHGRDVMSLDRQVRLTAGLMVLLFTVLGWAVSPVAYVGAGLEGAMLALTAALGICPMLSLLQKMPWNRGSSACPVKERGA